MPYLSALFVPTCTRIDPPLPGPRIFSTLSVISSIFVPGKENGGHSLHVSAPMIVPTSIFIDWLYIVHLLTG